MQDQAEQIWKKATDFLVPIYAATNKFPNDDLAVRINQLHATAVGIVLNLAEALSRENELDLMPFLDSSLKAAHDTIEELRIADRLNLCPPKEVEDLIMQAEEIARLLNGWINNLSQPAKT
jgi:four helix bundle protein